MIGFSLVGFHTSITAWHTSRAYSTSVSEKLSGEYSKRIFSVLHCSLSVLTKRVPSIAIALISSLDLLKVTFLCSGDVELYKCIIAECAPSKLSKVFLIRCSRA